MSTVSQRQLYVTWRRPAGLIVPVGRLAQIVDGENCLFRFNYLKGAERHAEFSGLPGLPDLHRSYEAGTLFPVFANRVMPRKRPDYNDFVEHLDLSAGADPFEVLGRSEGVRVTDRIEVFPDAEKTDDQQLQTKFFARGIRHLPNAAEAVQGLRPGDEFRLVPEPDNSVNPRALLLHAENDAGIGWAPDYLLDVIYELSQLNGTPPQIFVEHVNLPEVAPHLRLLCRLSAEWPAGYQPFSGPDFMPIG